MCLLLSVQVMHCVVLLCCVALLGCTASQPLPSAPHPPTHTPGVPARTAFSRCCPGTLPPSWGALSKLRVCYLGDNTLSGPLPGAWSGMAALEDLQLAINRLTGGASQWG
jgi:hypothetical protein